MKTKAWSSKAFVWILGILVLWGGELYSANPAATGLESPAAASSPHMRPERPNSRARVPLYSGH